MPAPQTEPPVAEPVPPPPALAVDTVEKVIVTGLSAPLFKVTANCSSLVPASASSTVGAETLATTASVGPPPPLPPLQAASAAASASAIPVFVQPNIPTPSLIR